MNHYLKKLITPHYQVGMIVITSILLVSLTMIQLNQFNNLDPSPFINSIEKLKNENKNIKPIPTGFYLRNFLNFDVIKNEFTVEAIVWFIVDPLKIDIATLGKFSVSKGYFRKSNILFNNNSPKIIKLNDGLQFVQYDVIINFSSNLNYRLFPIDSHRIYLALTNKHISADEYYFDIKPENFLISDTLYTFGWNNIGNNIKTGFVEYPFSKLSFIPNAKHPRIVISIDFLLNNIRNMLLIFMPLFVVFFLSLFSFSFDPSRNTDTIMSISGAVVPAILGYRFVIEAVAPKVTYFMLSDQIFNMFLVLSFLIFFINEFYLAKIKEYRGILVLSFHIILVLAWYYFLFIWG